MLFATSRKKSCYAEVRLQEVLCYVDLVVKVWYLIVSAMALPNLT